ncbi:UDP-glucoronosyl and UDP-glucosyl transferase [Trichostrongylus colubriformis]|uniref:glucuronosyltransferase n=1 Tax=Trichostrongylus colubriformis TaxID=6319 RepID=A0AAN8FEY5_TRICO
MSRLVLLCSLILNTNCANVLIWNPTIGHSHVRFLGTIADILFEDGHNVTIVSPIMDPHVNMVGHTSTIRQIPYLSKYMENDDSLAEMDIKRSSFWDEPAQGRSVSVKDFDRFIRIFQCTLRGLVEDKNFLASLRDYHFDVAIHEIYDPYQVGIFELIGVKKTVAVSALGVTPYVPEITGVPSNPSYIPGTYTTYSDDMTFWERLDNFKLNIELYYRFLNYERDTLLLFDKVYPGFPDFRKLLREKVGVILLNVNEFLETPRPTANIIRYIGGVTIREPKPLDEKFSDILDQRATNVLFSFGTFTQAKNMPPWLRRGILEAFAAFPNTTFIWKYEDDNDSDLLEGHPNVYRMMWVPQVDLLADKRLSAFVTHAGMNSIIEATFSGKPMVTIPLFGDQFLNAKNIQRRGIAVMIERNELNRDTLVAALREVLSPNTTYARKATEIARHLRGRAAAARAEVSHWVKLVAEEGQMDHLMMHSNCYCSLLNVDRCKIPHEKDYGLFG